MRQLVALARQRGISIRIVSGYRSTAFQQRLLEAWRRGVPGIIKPATPGRSYHNYGLAVDIATTPAAALPTVGRMAEALGLRWGGRFNDPVHIDAGNLVSIDEARSLFTGKELVSL